MPSFDVVSEVDEQEVRNALDQVEREVNTRFDFKNTNTTIEQNDMVITLRSVSEDRLAALRSCSRRRLVKRGVSLKGLDYGKIEEATQNTVRQVVTIKVGISSEKSREINKLLKSEGPEGHLQPDPGRLGSGVEQEARRPADHDGAAQGSRLRDPAAVQQLSRLADPFGSLPQSADQRRAICPSITVSTQLASTTICSSFPDRSPPPGSW